MNPNRVLSSFGLSAARVQSRSREMRRKKTRQIHVGNVPVGGKAPIAVQSMTNTDTRDVAATVRQIEQLQAAGCEIVRLAVPDEKAAAAFKEIKKLGRSPLIADIP